MRMTSKERVRRVLTGQEPDRIPVDYKANTGVDRRLKMACGLRENEDEGLRRVLGVDFRTVNPAHNGRMPHPAPPGRKVNMWGVRMRWIEHQFGGYWDYCDFPLKDANLAEVEAWPMPSPDDFDYTHIGEQCRRHSRYCVVYGGAGIGDIINGTGMIRTMEQVLVDLLLDEPACLGYIDRRLDIQYEVARRALEAGGNGYDLFYIGEDLGTQTGPLISPDLFRKHIRPRLQRLVDLAKSFNLPVMIHSCGSSSWAFEDFIAMGIKVVDTLQPEAVNMAPEYLKATYGKRLVFHGCISTAGPVATGDVAETVSSVRSILATMMPGGGYILAPTHRLQDNSPAANVRALYAAAKKYGKYAHTG